MDLTIKNGDLIMSHPLAGKAVLITGGSRGIGAAIVRRLANDGAAVAFTSAAAADKAQALVKEARRDFSTGIYGPTGSL
jgi:NAD(P)-dependent dehydrogenase (short-subunit alcohol dehydrogenase family)